MRRFASFRRTFQCSLGMLALGAVTLGAADASAEPSLGQEAGYGAASAFCSLIYSPIKIAYAATGSVVGGLAWLFSAGDAEVAGPIMTAAVRGDWIVSPDHLRGKRELEFIGRRPDDRNAREYGVSSAGF